MQRDEIASEKLRELVASWKLTGLPKPIKGQEAMRQINAEQQSIIDRIMACASDERSLSEDLGRPVNDTAVVTVRMKTREFLQQALLAGMAHFGIIQRQALGYGAIPHPDLGWKYCVAIDGDGYTCWECGEVIVGQGVRFSVRIENFAGAGEARTKIVPYCPKCEAVPLNQALREEPELRRRD